MQTLEGVARRLKPSGAPRLWLVTDAARLPNPLPAAARLPAGSAVLARDLAPEDKKATYLAKVERYEKEKAEIKAVADKLEAEGTQWDKQSDEQMHQHHRWAQATTVLQVAIAMAAIALLTRKKWLEYAMFAAGATGIVIGILAALHI
jgi:hypothetical protein